eukprot:XP_008187200.1 PREDICTED: uncharacterized protein LOC100569497 isoform X3 [Acyrthosiphon pisum]
MDYNGFKYKSNGKKNGVCYYVCSSPNMVCKGSLKRTNDGTVIECKRHIHDAYVDVDDRLKYNFRQHLLERSTSETTNLRNIYDEEAIRTPDAARVYSWPTAESSMRKARAKNTPVLPATLRGLGETLDENRQKYKCGNHQFYQEWIFDDQGKCHLMFGCPELVNIVVSSGGTELHADGTFKVVPSRPKCRQLFIIHLIIQNHSIPICYVLMESKTQEAYTKVLNRFKVIFQNVQPSVIMTDYERGLRNAFAITYPEAELVSCYFHYVQSLWKNIKKMQLTAYLRHNEHGKMCLKMMMVLALLPANEIEDGFQDIKDYALVNDVNMARFFTYFSSFWLVQIGPQVFSVYGKPRRTNNNIESFHNKLKDKFQVSHPNLWTVLGHLQNLSQSQHVVINQFNRGLQITRSVKFKYIINSRRIKMCTEKLTLGIITRKEFLLQCSYTVNGYLEREANWARFIENDDNAIEENLPMQLLNNNESDNEDRPNFAEDGPLFDNDNAIEENLPMQLLNNNAIPLIRDNPESDNEDRPNFAEDGPLFDNDNAIEDNLPMQLLNNNDDDNVNSCVVCLTEPSTHACAPCGHRCLCETCSTGPLNRCPLCQGEIILIMRIFN